MALTNPIRRANRNRPLADLYLIAIGDLRGRQIFRVHLDDGDVGAFIAADELGVLILRAVLEADGDRIGAVDDVQVRENITVATEDNARTLAVNVVWAALRHRLEEKLERRALELLAVIAIFTLRGFLRTAGLAMARNDDDGRARLVGDTLERIFQMSREIEIALVGC